MNDHLPLEVLRRWIKRESGSNPCATGKIVNGKSKPNWQDAAINAAIIMGLVGGLISLPKSIIDLFPRSHIKVERNRPVSMTYNRKLNNIECSTGVLIYNSGNKAEFIFAHGAHLGAPNDPSGGLVFAGSDLILKDGEREISSVNAEQNKTIYLTCEIPLDTSRIGDLFTQQPTHRELVLDFVSKDGRVYSAYFDFDLTEDVREQLIDPKGPGTIKFVDSVQ